VAGPAGSGASQYAYIYNMLGETVAIEADVPFSSNGTLTAGFTHTPNSSQILVVDAGTYKVTFSVSGSEPNQMALYVDGVLVAGSIYGSGAGTQENVGQVIVPVTAGAVLTLRNHSSAAAVTLATPIGGTAPNANASVLIEQLG
jgi:hypothetical protein